MYSTSQTGEGREATPPDALTTGWLMLGFLHAIIPGPKDWGDWGK